MQKNVVALHAGQFDQGVTNAGFPGPLLQNMPRKYTNPVSIVVDRKASQLLARQLTVRLSRFTLWR